MSDLFKKAEELLKPIKEKAASEAERFETAIERDAEELADLVWGNVALNGRFEGNPDSVRMRGKQRLDEHTAPYGGENAKMAEMLHNELAALRSLRGDGWTEDIARLQDRAVERKNDTENVKNEKTILEGEMTAYRKELEENGIAEDKIEEVLADARAALDVSSKKIKDSEKEAHDADSRLDSAHEEKNVFDKDQSRLSSSCADAYDRMRETLNLSRAHKAEGEKERDKKNAMTSLSNVWNGVMLPQYKDGLRDSEGIFKEGTQYPSDEFYEKFSARALALLQAKYKANEESLKSQVDFAKDAQYVEIRKKDLMRLEPAMAWVEELPSRMEREFFDYEKASNFKLAEFQKKTKETEEDFERAAKKWIHKDKALEAVGEKAKTLLEELSTHFESFKGFNYPHSSLSLINSIPSDVFYLTNLREGKDAWGQVLSKLEEFHKDSDPWISRYKFSELFDEKRRASFLEALAAISTIANKSSDTINRMNNKMQILRHCAFETINDIDAEKRK